MKAYEFLFESRIVDQLLSQNTDDKDPKLKAFEIAFRNDTSIPLNSRALLVSKGKSSAKNSLLAWREMIDKALANTGYGDMSAGRYFEEWLFNRYIQFAIDYEDISGEADVLGMWKVLKVRNLLIPAHQDLNKFKDIRSIRDKLRDRNYSEALKKIRNQEKIKAAKKNKKEIVLIDNDRFLVVLPLNFGSCYYFNNSMGIQASFCTGSSSGETWFSRYAPEGVLISIIDKNNSNDVNGKWQLHAPSNQMKNALQTNSGLTQSDQKFAELFPGLLKQITQAMHQKTQEIQSFSDYDVDSEIEKIKNKFPRSYQSEETAS